MTDPRVLRDSVLRIGEVTKVSGQSIEVRVDKNRNASDILYDGDILKNIAVNSFVEIRKGFKTLIGKVDGERLEELHSPPTAVKQTDRNKRILQVSLAGYVDSRNRFTGGLSELPLIGNEVFIVTKETIRKIHSLASEEEATIQFGITDGDSFDIDLPINGLFNSHIAIFGNTGSGKSNTLASLYGSFVAALQKRNEQAYKNNVRILLLDFNGEYTGAKCITPSKFVYQPSTSSANDQRLPLSLEALSNIEILSILADASEKTQKPFLKRVLSLHASIQAADMPLAYFRGILRNNLRATLRMSERQRAYLLLDYFAAILPRSATDGQPIDVHEGLTWHSVQSAFYSGADKTSFFTEKEWLIEGTTIAKLCAAYEFETDFLAQIIAVMYVQLISDIISNRAQNDHIAPVINRLSGRKADIAKIFNTSGSQEFWKSNFIVVSLDRVNLDMRKTIPLLLVKKLYQEHKEHRNTKSLTIIIDEAHNILSTQSFREAESWKDYRLETFEEIIKEGRKFGVFVTISSQRPNDISATITSQSHNYFIHRLVNQKDLQTITSAVSYIDSVSESSIPTLPVGTCIFSGVAGQMPLKISVRPLEESTRPRSSTLSFHELVPDEENWWK